MNKAAVAFLLFILQFGNLSWAQAPWPARPVKIIVPFAPGSFTDTAARAVAVELGNQLGQPFVIENRGGAGSTIGTDAVAKAAPDGYTFLLTDNSFAVSAALYKSLPYHPSSDIAQVALVADAPAVLAARNGLKTRTLRDTVEFARKNPGTLNFGSGGQGSSAHLAMEAFLLQNGLKMVHVPFKGVAEAMTEIAADRIDVGIGSVGSTVQHINGKRLFALAVSGKQRNPMLPDVPTFAEAGYPEYGMMYWFGVMAPAAVPAAIVERMNQEVGKAVKTDRVAKTFAAAGVTTVVAPAAAFRQRVADEISTWKDVIARAHIEAQ